MEKEINIAAILNSKPETKKIWSIVRGEYINFCKISGYIECESRYSRHYFYYNGKDTCNEKAIVVIAPSYEMQDWSKFAWKKGDFIKRNTKKGNTCIFVRFTSDDYTTFEGIYGESQVGSYCNTNEWQIVKNEQKIKDIVYRIEKQYHGKLNLETLKIEKPQFKDGDIVRQGVLKGTNIYIIKNCIDKIDNKYDYYARYNTQEKEVNYNDWSHISPTARLATVEDIHELFVALDKDGKAWDADEKQIVDLPKKCELKAFDKVLVRNYDSWKWRINLFSHYDTETQFEYACLSGNFLQCIPYNDQTAHLLGTTDDWKGGNND